MAAQHSPDQLPVAQLPADPKPMNLSGMTGNLDPQHAAAPRRRRWVALFSCGAAIALLVMGFPSQRSWHLASVAAQTPLESDESHDLDDTPQPQTTEQDSEKPTASAPATLDSDPPVLRPAPAQPILPEPTPAQIQGLRIPPVESMPVIPAGTDDAAIEEQFRRAITDPDSIRPTGNPMLDGMLEHIRARHADSDLPPALPSLHPVPDSQTFSEHEASYRVAEQLLRTARLLSQLPADPQTRAQREALVAQMRLEAKRILQTLP